MFQRCVKNTKGVAALEYGLIAASISVALLSSMSQAGLSVKQSLCLVSESISTTSSCSGTGTPSQSTSLTQAALSSQDYLTRDVALAQAWLNKGNGQYAATLPVAYGGWGVSDRISLNAQNYIQRINALNNASPLSTIFGIYDNNGKPVTDPKTVLSLFNSGASLHTDKTTWNFLTVSQSGNVNVVVF